VPIPIPRIEGIVDALDAYGPMHGLMVVEGPDIAIERYGGQVACPYDLIEPPDLGRDAVEFALIERVLDQGQAYLGLCRGCHGMNVARGGTLYGDVRHELGSDLKHVDLEHYDAYRHEITVVEGTPLEGWLGTARFPANSYHHQGIRTLGDGFLPMCHTADGLIEGFYDPRRRFLVGLQFHPERHIVDDGSCGAIFEAFVRAAEDYQNESQH
jgi:putative glutamine amidotransferase